MFLVVRWIHCFIHPSHSFSVNLYQPLHMSPLSFCHPSHTPQVSQVNFLIHFSSDSCKQCSIVLPQPICPFPSISPSCVTYCIAEVYMICLNSQSFFVTAYIIHCVCCHVYQTSHLYNIHCHVDLFSSSHTIFIDKSFHVCLITYNIG